MQYNEYINSLSNPATSYWLLARLKEIETRDIVDFLRDVTILKQVAETRFKEISQA
mgnify:CR=1 FL=1